MKKLVLSSEDEAQLAEIAKRINATLDDNFHGDVYDVLVEHAGAHPQWKDDFVRSCRTTSEYRFQGVFGFGGKYWPERQRITYYPEDRTDHLDDLRDRINVLIADLADFAYGRKVPP